MKTRTLALAVASVFALSAFAEETSVKQDVKDAAHAIKREWKKGWRATKKAAKEVTHEAADATEKAAKKTKENIDN